MTNTYMNGSAGLHSTTETRPKRQRKKASSPAPHVVPLSLPAPPWWDISRKQLLAWGATALLFLAGAGWLAIPAKQSDLQVLAKDMAAGFERIEHGFKAINHKFDALGDKLETMRADIARVQAVQEYEAGAPAAPVRPARRAKTKATSPSAKSEVKATNIFGF